MGTRLIKLADMFLVSNATEYIYVCGFGIQEFLTSALYELKKSFFLEATKH
jgi:hypothetical protein